jgi:quercetin dioxygenase-like cupin family protein
MNRPPDALAGSAVVLAPGESHPHGMRRISALFNAEGTKVAGRHSISEWWFEPETQGPGEHTRAQDDVFYVLEGTVSFLVEGTWIDAPKGSFVLVPAGVKHNFENRSAARVGVLNFTATG